MAVYSSGSRLDWRRVWSGELPSPLWRMQVTLVGNILFLNGGSDDQNHTPTSILAWDPVAETWQAAGDLAEARYLHAAVAVPASTIAEFCTN